MTKFPTLSYTSTSEIPSLSYTVNQPPPPPAQAYLFETQSFEGGLFKREGLFNLAKTMVSVLHKKTRMQSGKAQGQWLEVMQPKDKNKSGLFHLVNKPSWISPYKVLQS